MASLPSRVFSPHQRKLTISSAHASAWAHAIKQASLGAQMGLLTCTGYSFYTIWNLAHALCHSMKGIFHMVLSLNSPGLLQNLITVLCMCEIQRLLLPWQANSYCAHIYPQRPQQCSVKSTSRVRSHLDWLSFEFRVLRETEVCHVFFQAMKVTWGVGL